MSKHKHQLGWKKKRQITFAIVIWLSLFGLFVIFFFLLSSKLVAGARHARWSRRLLQRSSWIPSAAALTTAPVRPLAPGLLTTTAAGRPKRCGTETELFTWSTVTRWPSNTERASNKRNSCFWLFSLALISLVFFCFFFYQRGKDKRKGFKIKQKNLTYTIFHLMYNIQKSILRDPDSFLYSSSSLLHVSFLFILFDATLQLIGGFPSIAILIT